MAGQEQSSPLDDGKLRTLDNKVAGIDAKLARLAKEFAQAQAEAAKHHGDGDNPHAVTKEHIGLDQVENLPPVAIGPHLDGLALAKDVYTFSMENFLPKDHVFPFESVVLGQEAGHYGGKLGASVLIGARAGKAGLAEFKDYVTIGADTHPLASRTVSIGHSRDIFTMPKDVVVRADKRDFKNVRDLDLGLKFVLQLKPRVATMDLREDYIDYASMPTPPPAPPLPPTMPRSDEHNPANLREWKAYREGLDHWQKHIDAPYQDAMVKWRRDYRAWQKQNHLSTIANDGSRQHVDEHAVLLADEVANAADILKTTFSGVIDFKELGGLDIKGLRPSEMVPVLVKAIQDLHAYIHSDDFVESIVGRMLQNGLRGRQALRIAATTVKNLQAEDAHRASLLSASNDAAPPEPASDESPVTD